MLGSEDTTQYALSLQNQRWARNEIVKCILMIMVDSAIVCMYNVRIHLNRLNDGFVAIVEELYMLLYYWGYQSGEGIWKGAEGKFMGLWNFIIN